MSFTWENTGSYKDLSRLLPGDPVTALAPTSQAGGNMTSDSTLAMTAPGSPPVDPLPDRDKQGDPTVTASNRRNIPPATSGKPQASRQSGPPGYPAPSWKKTTVPDVLRES